MQFFFFIATMRIALSQFNALHRYMYAYHAYFFKMCSQNAGNAISETQILNISWGACPQTPS
jgi:hypothetical protein